MKLTMPQAIMLNHASWVSRKNSDRKYDAKRERDKSRGSAADRAEAAKVEQLDPAAMSNYMRQGWE